jgi:para-nitrobenzyl esterase
VALALLFACGDPSPGVTEGPKAPPSSEDPAVDDTRPDAPDVLDTDRGRIRGTKENGAWVWRGIPYAAPPTGDQRWKPPAAATAWPDVRDGSQFGSKCVQTAPDTTDVTGGSEDCLTLNVWRPDKPAPPGGFPVMFFIHGGYNLRGSSSDELEPGIRAYDGKALVARDVVFVSINYRLGALGWLGGNWGALDQVAALEWVQRNAAALSADPKRVLVFGQSAGATNTCALYASPMAAGLFSRAVMHSGTCGAMTAEKMAQGKAVIAEKLGCDGAEDVLACLRKRPAADVAAAATIDLKNGGFTWGHSVDGSFLPATPAQLIIAKKHNHVPLVVGVTAHEMTSLWRSAYPTVPIPKTPEDHETALRTIFGEPLGEKVGAAYPSSSYSSPAMATVAALSDASFVCPARALSRAASVAQAEPVRRFYFSHVLESGPARALGAAHGFDLLFVFRPEKLSFFTPSAAEQALSDTMIGYFTRFATAGDPNGDGAPEWPEYDVAADSHLVLDTDVRVETKLRTEQCDFWASL